ncbi:MAG: hypothetical protein J2P36_35500, partial [Ktedonobacteraceae bacterium]|nr:hypothetical protein [Ktedonobacteraceae bacterium]
MSRNKSYNSRNRKYTSRENHLAKKQKKIKAYTLANIEDEPSEQKNTQVSAEIEAPDSQQTADVVTSHVGETATENEQEPAMELSHNDA